MAVLDYRKTGADYAGNMSDPRLVNQLLYIGPSEPLEGTAYEVADAVLQKYAESKSLSPATSATLRDMIFGKD